MTVKEKVERAHQLLNEAYKAVDDVLKEVGEKHYLDSENGEGYTCALKEDNLLITFFPCPDDNPDAMKEKLAKATGYTVDEILFNLEQV